MYIFNCTILTLKIKHRVISDEPIGTFGYELLWEMLLLSCLFTRMVIKNAIKTMAKSILAESSPFKIALVQLGGVGFNKTVNLAHAREKILEAAKNGAQVVVLPVRLTWPIDIHFTFNHDLF